MVVMGAFESSGAEVEVWEWDTTHWEGSGDGWIEWLVD